MRLLQRRAITACRIIGEGQEALQAGLIGPNMPHAQMTNMTFGAARQTSRGRPSLILHPQRLDGALAGINTFSRVPSIGGFYHALSRYRSSRGFCDRGPSHARHVITHPPL